MQYLPLISLLFIGLLIGLSGIGGFLIAPVLIIVFPITLREAIVASLAAQIFVYLGSFYLYWKQEKVDFKVSRYLILGSIPGALLGLTANLALSEEILRIVLAVFLLMIVIFLLAKDSFNLNLQDYNHMPLLVLVKNNKKLAKTLGLLVLGLLGGVMASLIGVGGPVTFVPVLILFGYGAKISIGSALFSGIFNVAIALTFHLLYTTVGLPFILLASILTVLGSLMGAVLSDIISPKISRLIVIYATLFSIIYLLLFA